MIIGFTKQMHSFIVGQPRKKSMAQQKRVDSYIYSFMTTINQNDIDWDGVYDVIMEFLTEIMNIELYNVKDMEISLDIPSGKYSIRFTSIENLTENAYAAELQWQMQHMSGESSQMSEVYPWEYINDKNYMVEVFAEPLTLKEIGALFAE